MDGRRFRFDFAWADKMLGVEIEGGVFSGGRHTRGVGYSRDLEKYNLAAMHGWTVYRFTTQDVKQGIAVRFITIIIKNQEAINRLSRLLFYLRNIFKLGLTNHPTNNINDSFSWHSIIRSYFEGYFHILNYVSHISPMLLFHLVKSSLSHHRYSNYHP